MMSKAWIVITLGFGAIPFGIGLRFLESMKESPILWLYAAIISALLVLLMYVAREKPNPELTKVYPEDRD